MAFDERGNDLANRLRGYPGTDDQIPARLRCRGAKHDLLARIARPIDVREVVARCLENQLLRGERAGG